MDGASIRKAYDGSDDDGKVTPTAGADIRAAFDSAEPEPPPSPPPTYKAPLLLRLAAKFGDAMPGTQEEARADLAPAPNTTYGTYAPLARDNTTGAIRLAMPSSVRDFGNGLLDAITPPPMGQTISPEGTLALGGITAGPLGGSLAQGTGALIARAYENRLLAKATESTGAAPSALLPPPANDTAALPPAMPGPAAEPVLVNPLAPQAAPQVNQLTAPATVSTPAPIAPSVATPTKAPTAKFLPIRTADQADAEADRIIKHFAGTGNTAIDTSSAIPGSKPTLSQAIVGGNPGIAGLERAMRDAGPNDFVAQETANQQARADHLVSITGTPADLAAAEAERDAATAKAKTAAFANPQPTDPTPVVNQIDAILKSGQGQRSTVASALKDIRSKLIDANGVMQTDPEQLYGIRQHINDIISPKAAGTAADARAAARELMTVKASLDPVIEQGAPGFTNYIKQYEELSKPINGMQYMQNMQLTDAQGKIQLGRLNSAVNGLERQQAAPGARLADGVTDDQLGQLKALRDDFRRDAKQNQGTSFQSATVQKLGTNRVMETLGHPVVAATGALGAVTNPFVAIPAMAARYGLQKAGDRGQAMVLDALRRKLLNPEQATSAFQTTK